MPSKKKSPVANETVVAADSAAAASAPAEDVAIRFIGQWNRLVSTTNWEKGRIICQWREALELAAAAVTAYSDEAWAQLVGGVTSQHVGRLRRVFQRFGATFDQYEGLYWSHFQAGLDWEDAEMWLEGALLNSWSVSQMRGKRWETLGNAGEAPADAAADETMDGSLDDSLNGDAASPDGEAASAAGRIAKTVDSPPWEAASDADEADADSTTSGEKASREPSPTAASPATGSPAKSRVRLAVDVDELPEDLAEAFEQFKLAIIAQRRLGWSETSPDAVIECLDALKELALAPADG